MIMMQDTEPVADAIQRSADRLRARLEQLAAANPLHAAQLALVDAIMSDAKQKQVPCDLRTEWIRAGTDWLHRPGYHQCLEPDGEVRWVPDTPDYERQRALGNTLRAQGMPDEAIETILWMDHELHVQQRKTDSVEDAEPVEPIRRTRSRKPTVTSVVRQAAKAGLAVARVEVDPTSGKIAVVTGKPTVGSDINTNNTTPLDRSEWN
jgi:hypothetical protein